MDVLELILQNTSGPLPTSTYTLFNNRQEVGFIQIRHRASHSQEIPGNFASHIYYEIKPEYRRHGYGKEILRLGLEEARKIGLKEIIITCHDDDAASKKIIEINGGILVDSYIIQTDKKKFLKYILKID